MTHHLDICTNFSKRSKFPQKESCTGIYWGAFDPPTKAHRAIIEIVLAEKWLRDLIVVINNHNYKSYTYSLEERKLMMEDIILSLDAKNVTLLAQDDNHPLDYQVLTCMTPYPLCAIAGYDAYKKIEKDMEL